MKWILNFLLVIPGAAFAASVVPEVEAIRENPGTFQFFIGLVIIAALWLVAKYVRDSDQNNREQWKRIDNHERRISKLEGEHHAHVCLGRRAYDNKED